MLVVEVEVVDVVEVEVVLEVEVDVVVVDVVVTIEQTDLSIRHNCVLAIAFLNQVKKFNYLWTFHPKLRIIIIYMYLRKFHICYQRKSGFRTDAPTGWYTLLTPFEVDSLFFLSKNNVVF